MAYQSEKSRSSPAFLAGSVFPDIRLTYPELADYHKPFERPASDFERGINHHLWLDETRLKLDWVKQTQTNGGDYVQALKLFEDQIISKLIGREILLSACDPGLYPVRTLDHWLIPLREYLENQNIEHYIASFGHPREVVEKRLQIIRRLETDSKLANEIERTYQRLASGTAS